MEERRAGPRSRAVGMIRAEARALGKRVQRAVGVARYDGNFMRQRLPAITTDELQRRADRLASLLGSDVRVQVRQRETDLFETRAV